MLYINTSTKGRLKQQERVGYIRTHYEAMAESSAGYCALSTMVNLECTRQRSLIVPCARSERTGHP
jgi:hypothetical protein